MVFFLPCHGRGIGSGVYAGPKIAKKEKKKKKGGEMTKLGLIAKKEV